MNNRYSTSAVKQSLTSFHTSRQAPHDLSCCHSPSALRCWLRTEFDFISAVMQAPSTPASLLLAARRISGSAPPNGLAHARPDSIPAPGQPWSTQDNARQLLSAAREPYNTGAANRSDPLRHTRPVSTSGPEFQSARATYTHPWLSPLHAISDATTRRAEIMLRFSTKKNEKSWEIVG